MPNPTAAYDEEAMLDAERQACRLMERRGSYSDLDGERILRGLLLTVTDARLQRLMDSLGS